MNNLYLIAHINGACIGIESSQIESIVHVHDVVPVPNCDPSVAGLFALRSRVLTLIDTQFLITQVRKKVEKGALAVVVDISGHQYGLLVDKVEDVVSISPDEFENQIKPSKKWAPLVGQTASVNDRLVMILETAALVNGDQVLAA